MQLKIDEILARRLVATQFPQWRDLPIQSVALSGWGNIPIAPEGAMGIVENQTM